MILFNISIIKKQNVKNDLIYRFQIIGKLFVSVNNTINLITLVRNEINVLIDIGDTIYQNEITDQMDINMIIIIIIELDHENKDNRAM